MLNIKSKSTCVNGLSLLKRSSYNTYIDGDRPPTARDRMTKIKKMKKDCGCKDKK